MWRTLVKHNDSQDNVSYHTVKQYAQKRKVKRKLLCKDNQIYYVYVMAILTEYNT